MTCHCRDIPCNHPGNNRIPAEDCVTNPLACACIRMLSAPTSHDKYVPLTTNRVLRKDTSNRRLGSRMAICALS